MRLLCIDNSGCPELEVGAIYTGEWTCKCKRAYYLDQVKEPNPYYLPISSGYTSCECGRRNKTIENDRYNGYRKQRFIEIDDIHEIEQAEYSEQLQNV